MRLAFLLLAGCGTAMWYSIDPGTALLNGEEQRLVGEAIASYTEHIGDPGDDCREMLPELRIRWTTREQTPAACHNPGNYGACLRSNDGLQGSVNVTRRTIWIVINQDLPEPKRSRKVIHEAFHWLERCDGRREFFHTSPAFNNPIVYGPGWREAELEAQRRAGLR